MIYNTPMPILTKAEFDRIRSRPPGSTFTLMVDFGRRGVTVHRQPDSALLDGRHRLGLDAKIKPKSCYLLEQEEIMPLAFFDENTNIYYKLIPTRDWPTISFSSVPMHRRDSPRTDTENKLRILRPRGRLLDTCMGLGYSALLGSRTAREVHTYEIDTNVTGLARVNPWSQEAFSTPSIHCHQGNIAAAIEKFPSRCFDSVLHDPPTFTLSPDLYSDVFYAALKRILRPGGTLFHYAPRYKMTHGYDFPAKTQRRLRAAGFTDCRLFRKEGGILCRR
ncbi:MAG: spermine synthase [Candidatus Omnitrophica bacterium]|nr:spermine synthase [Candidatus Omnitrophota bacterium]